MLWTIHLSKSALPKIFSNSGLDSHALHFVVKFLAMSPARNSPPCSGALPHSRTPARSRSRFPRSSRGHEAQFHSSFGIPHSAFEWSLLTSAATPVPDSFPRVRHVSPDVRRSVRDVRKSFRDFRHSVPDSPDWSPDLPDSVPDAPDSFWEAPDSFPKAPDSIWGDCQTPPKASPPVP